MRLIDADTLDEAIVKESEGYQGSVYSCGISDGFMLSRQCIEEAPTVDAQPVVIGKWLWDENGMDWGLGAWRCSVCGNKPETWWEADQKYIPRRCSGSKFCGNCGAKME